MKDDMNVKKKDEINVNVTIRFDDAALKALRDEMATGFSGLGFGLSAIQRQVTTVSKEIKMAKEEVLAKIAEAKTAIAEMKTSLAADLAEIIRRLEEGAGTPEIVAALNEVITEVKGVDILPDFPPAPPPEPPA